VKRTETPIRLMTWMFRVAFARRPGPDRAPTPGRLLMQHIGPGTDFVNAMACEKSALGCERILRGHRSRAHPVA
jgi:hypothetical protein